MNMLRIAAFSDGPNGGNPAGVWLGDALPPAADMQVIAKEVGYSETVFAAPVATGFRVRYFAPEMEVPFCGHATIALGAALAMQHGDGVFALKLNAAAISVEGLAKGGTYEAALQSPPTKSGGAPAPFVAAALRLFGFAADDLDPALPPALINAGAEHLLLAIKSRAKLATMSYAMAAGRLLMTQRGLVTICLVNADQPQLFNARNAFASGGVLEDPATGAAAAAFGGYLRDLGWPHGGRIEIIQGEDMGLKSCIHVDIATEPGSSIRVSGQARMI